MKAKYVPASKVRCSKRQGLDSSTKQTQQRPHKFDLFLCWIVHDASAMAEQ